MPPEEGNPADKCPVDDKTRQKWLEAAKAKDQPTHPPHALTPPSSSPSPKQRVIALVAYNRYSLDKSRWETILEPSKEPIQKFQNIINANPRLRSLSTDREISTIPRAEQQSQSMNSAERAALPANSERDTGHDIESGNWIYPSQSMFFEAMKRKGHNPSSSDMSTIVPIHNAVNERAWSEIKQWESGRGSEACGGPKLISFSGDSKALTPRARWKNLVGYQKPFDRHDWVVDRCGKRVEYVIDFYSGSQSMSEGGKPLSFYLDVRPKLNSWEGVKTRSMSFVGM